MTRAEGKGQKAEVRRKGQVRMATLVLIAALGIAVLGSTARSQVRAGTAAEFFGAKRVYTFHLMIEPTEWTRMSESIASRTGPGGPGGMRGQSSDGCGLRAQLMGATPLFLSPNTTCPFVG